MPMQMGFRWYGEGNDKIKLSDIKQIPGVTSIVWALHHKMPGEVWEEAEIAEVMDQLHAYGFNGDVVESVNVHDDIKIGLPTRDQYIENYKQCIRNLSKFGVKVICYNFMPIFDWTRSNLFHEVGDGSTALFYEKGMIQDDYNAMAQYILDFTEKYNMSFPGWEPERMAKLIKNVLDTDLTGKVAVVTGAGGVLCSQMAKVLARAGAKVALINRSEEAINQYAAEINAEGGIARAYKANVLDRAALEEVAEKILAELGPCDILVNGAGGNNPKATTDKEYYEPGDIDADTKSFFDLDEAGVDAVFTLNFSGTLLPTQVFAQQMLDRGGNIINISSMNAFTPLTKIPAYSGAKAAISNFTQWLAVHFSKVGIRVNAIAPGFFSTKQNAKLLWNEDGTPTARTKKILAATPMDRFGKTEELDGALLFLVNDEAAGFITGVVLPVDGGFAAYSGV